MENKGDRISKRMAALGLCSRRDAERWIEAGRVAVNGKVIDTPVINVTDDDTIAIDGQEIENNVMGTTLWRYHKPRGLVVTHHDPEGRPTVFESLPGHLPRVVSVGRLDLDSEGLLLLTNSGALSRALELPKNEQKRTYRVRVKGMLSPDMIKHLARGITIDRVNYQPIIAEPEEGKSEGMNRWYKVTLREGKNREIRRVFDHFDMPVSRLIRVSYGNFELGDLAPGKVAEVPASKVDALVKKLSAE